MDAILIEQGQGLLQVGETPEPALGDDEIMVRVRAAGVNRADILQRKGLYPPPPGVSPILGLEVAGEVSRTGSKCRRWRVGDRVFAVIQGGGYARFAAVHESLAMPIPEVMGFEAAAAIGEVFLTAYQALFWLGELRPRCRVLIHAGASGVGTAAIQMARTWGSQVIVTAGSEEKLRACVELGAEIGINYRQEDFVARVLSVTGGKGVDLILDFIGASYLNRNMTCIAEDGRLVILSLLGGRSPKDVDLALLLLKRIKIIGSTLRSRDLLYRIRLAEEFVQRWLPRFSTGELKPVIDRILPWDRAAEAHRILEENRNVGKVVLSLD